MANKKVHLISLGCARNDVDSEELAGRLEAGGFSLVDEPDSADALIVNTCGFVEQAKKDSIDTILAAADLKDSGGPRTVVAVGCLAQRYGAELADSLPEADAVLGFDDYTDIAERLRTVMAGGTVQPPTVMDRRTLLPIAPIERHRRRAVPGHQGELPTGIAPASGPRVPRRRLDNAPWAPLKIASGCDRRCAFCAIPSFRGAYLSRDADEIVEEAGWLVRQGVREIMLVSENSSSYGKDLADLRALESLLKRLSALDGLDWIRVSYLQPAELRSSLVDVMTSTPKVLPYFDLSFQHASAPLLRRMRRFGDPESFLGLIDSIRQRAPQAGIRSNVIVGFPGETSNDVDVLADFLARARLDAVGVFSYSDEDGTAAAELPDHVAAEEIEARHERIADLANVLCDERAAQRVGQRVQVLVEGVEGSQVTGRAAHQGPDVDGTTTVLVGQGRHMPTPGDMVSASVIDTVGVDLTAEIDEEG
ncbi:30S ribosomal protein S12 methylthiotransferase RimO [Propionibacterium freudenreichii]|uniref:30S ribosomal protein S12 methylthiotransferase RimO n=1 Tax=Propionibacterium freudenreichii TaxID=1744 RepID=UPI0021A59F35|nr:30S ribosomal protein S12 methylthiotransferase RimO [Propionibacterium freudenreichii]MCT3003310.1 30S ribosomal protein S12 methylthiotransferase RimO [Propionibacterium freudenreichii]